MKFYHYSSIKKATMALLDLFNNIKIRYETDNGYEDKVIPISFRSKERALLLSDQETQALLEGNTSIIPRLSLSFIGFTRNDERKTNKYLPINSSDDGKVQYNAIPVDINFELNYLCRTMTELSEFLEQIYPLFTPTYTLEVLELKDSYSENLSFWPTSIPILLDDPSIDINDDYDNNEIRLITCTIPVTYRGNLYPFIQNRDLIKQIYIYLKTEENYSEYDERIFIDENREVTYL